MIQSNRNPFEGVPIIYSYSRKQAIEDGVLVDLTEWARPIGFIIPVACTAAVWHRHVEPQEGSTALGESERVRAHVLLWWLHVNISKQTGATDPFMYEVVYRDDAGRRQTISLKAACGPGDDGEPVLTLMEPNED